MGIVTNSSAYPDLVDTALDVLQTVPETALPTTEYNKVITTIVGSDVNFRFEYNLNFLFNVYVYNPRTVYQWEINTTP